MGEPEREGRAETEPDLAEMDAVLTVTTGRLLPCGTVPSGKRRAAIGRMVRDHEVLIATLIETFPAPGSVERGP